MAARATTTPLLALSHGVGHASSLARWADTFSQLRPEADRLQRSGLRFAFYGRVSTEDHQGPVTSRAWQLLRAQSLIAGHGRIVAESFDIGHSRTLPWARRPEAAALLAAMADPDREFDAIVIGSSERAFHGNQFTVMAPLFEHYGIVVWIPELGGAADPEIAGHEELMVLLGILAKREIARTRIRVRTAMTVQARDQGRYLGGRPPYGYRLVDAGPHPNRALARRGVRLQRLDTDPQCAPVVRWIFTQRLAGHSIARITRGLNDAAIPCPSATDPDRNAHRSAEGWTVTTVRAVLANPRYTGRQVWNRQRTERELIDPDNTTLGHRDVMRWNTPDDWVISTTPAHPALVSEADFIAVQNLRVPREGVPGRVYLLAGLLRCGQCGRLLDSCWSHNRPAYRCRHGCSSATGPRLDGPRNLYLREDHVTPHLPALWIRLTNTEYPQSRPLRGRACPRPGRSPRGCGPPASP